MSKRKSLPAMAALAIACGLISALTVFAGKPQPPPALTNPAFVFIAPDGSGLSVMSSDGALQRRVTTAPRKGYDSTPVCSADGTKIAFVRSTSTGAFLCTVNADGTNLTTYFQLPIEGTPAAGRGMSWSSDGSYLLYASPEWSAPIIIDVNSQTGAFASMPEQVGNVVLSDMGWCNPSLGPDLRPDVPGFQGLLVTEAYLLPSGTSWSGLAIMYAEITTIGAQISVDLSAPAFIAVPPIEENDIFGGARYPVFSRAGDQIAFYSSWVHAVGGKVLNTVSVHFDTETGVQLGEPMQLFDWGDLHAFYYRPTWSPNDAYIGFSGCSEIAHWTLCIDLYVIPSDGSVPPVGITSTTDRTAGGLAPDWCPTWVDLP